MSEIALLLVAVYLTISQFTRSRASSYIERFNSSDALESRVAVDAWLRAHATTRERLEALDRDPGLRTHLRRFANLFQELGAAYQFRVAHRKTVRVLFDALVVMYWKSLRFWVEDYRAQTDPTLYARFEYLYEQIVKRRRKSTTNAQYLVAYGSLLSPDSLAAGLGRRVVNGELVPVALRGWARRWAIGESVRLENDRQERVAVFLDVARTEEGALSTAMVRVRPHEMRRLRTRERNYEPVDVTADVALTGGRRVAAGSTVWCFVGRDEHRVGPDTSDAVILSAYVEKVAEAVRPIDPEGEAGIRSSAVESGFEVVAGPYRFTDADQAALV